MYITNIMCNNFTANNTTNNTSCAINDITLKIYST